MYLNLQLAQEYFSDFMEKFVESKDVFLAFTVAQGENVVNAYEARGSTIGEGEDTTILSSGRSPKQPFRG